MLDSAEYTSVITTLALTLLGVGAYVAYLGRLIDRGCPHCPHCQARIREEEARKALADAEYRERLGLPPPDGSRGRDDGGPKE